MNTSNPNPFTMVLALLLLMASCGEQGDQPSEPSADTADSGKKKEEKIDVYSFAPTQLVAHWNRKKDIERDSTKLKIGKVDLNLQVENLNYTASGELPVDSISLTTYEEAFVSGFLSVDARAARKLTTGENGSIEVEVPEYLNTEDYPKISFEFEVIGLEGDTLDLVGALQINGNNQQVQAKGTMPEWNDSEITSFYISLKLDALAAGLSAIDSDQKVRSDELRIEIKR